MIVNASIVYYRYGHYFANERLPSHHDHFLVYVWRKGPEIALRIMNCVNQPITDNASERVI